MVSRKTCLAIGIGGFLSANSVLAQGYCTIPYDAGGQVQLSILSQALSDCAQVAPIWSEIVDQGTYEILYNAPEGNAERQVTGVSHATWSRDIEMKIGALFGFQALVMAQDSDADLTTETIVHPPSTANGPRPAEIVTATTAPGQVTGAFFLIGSERFMIPGLWRIELRSNGIILAAQRFNIVNPNAN